RYCPFNFLCAPSSGCDGFELRLVGLMRHDAEEVGVAGLAVIAKRMTRRRSVNGARARRKRFAVGDCDDRLAPARLPIGQARPPLALRVQADLRPLLDENKT